MPYHRKLPIISYPDFLAKVTDVTHFTSSQGRQYRVTNLRNEVLHIRREDANKDIDWDIDLKKLYRAYTELENFATRNFGAYIPRRHSPGRGLLLSLGLIE